MQSTPYSAFAFPFNWLVIICCIEYLGCNYNYGFDIFDTDALSIELTRLHFLLVISLGLFDNCLFVCNVARWNFSHLERRDILKF